MVNQEVYSFPTGNSHKSQILEPMIWWTAQAERVQNWSMKNRSENISLIMKLYNGIWTLNYCSHPHTKKPYQVVVFFISHGIQGITCQEEEKVLKTLGYQRQEYNVQELSNGEEHSLIKGNQSEGLRILRSNGKDQWFPWFSLYQKIY